MRKNARALSFAVFLSGSLTAAPALAEEAASATRPGSLAQAATLDAQTTAATDGLSLQFSGGSWEQAMDELRAPGSLRRSMRGSSLSRSTTPRATAGARRSESHWGRPVRMI
jgi:hypothetical protein